MMVSLGCSEDISSDPEQLETGMLTVIYCFTIDCIFFLITPKIGSRKLITHIHINYSQIFYQHFTLD